MIQAFAFRRRRRQRQSVHVFADVEPSAHRQVERILGKHGYSQTIICTHDQLTG
jgi:hypothetical protein